MTSTGTTSTSTTCTPATSGYRATFGKRLHLVQATIGTSARIEPVDLLVANLIVEYVGLEEFVTFAAGNAHGIGVLSCVIQRNDSAGFVSSTEHSHSFDGLASVSSDIDPDALTAAMSTAGFVDLGRTEYPLPNGKTLVRPDFRTPSGSARTSAAD